jgi:hypothetical protein
MADETKYQEEGKADDEAGEYFGDGDSFSGDEDGEDVDDEDMVVVCVVIQPGNFEHTVDVVPTCTLDKLIAEVSGDLRINADAVSLRLPSKVTGEYVHQPTTDDQGNAVVISSLELDSAAPHLRIEAVIDTQSAVDKQVLPDSIRVEFWRDNGDGREPELVSFQVQIERHRDARKPFLGGFRHKSTGQEYHHAKTQSDPPNSKKKNKGRSGKQARKANESKEGDGNADDEHEQHEEEAEVDIERFHRTTQTFVEQSRSCQTQRESGTQMERSDLLLDKSRDKTVNARSYFSADELHELKTKMTITVQRYWRGCTARHRAMLIRSAVQERRDATEAAEVESDKRARSKHQRNVQRRMNPRSFADFEILYTELEHWREHETMRIKATQGLSSEDKQEALAQLLAKETRLLQTIDRLKISASVENRESRIAKFLRLMSSPKKWELRDGKVAMVQTPFTNRAAELEELYKGLTIGRMSVDERLDVLLHVKWTVKEFDCNLTREIVELIDREADLLNRGRSFKSMKGLRRRTENLFLQFVETPEFNPEAARFQKVPEGYAHRPNVRPLHS